MSQHQMQAMLNHHSPYETRVLKYKMYAIRTQIPSLKISLLTSLTSQQKNKLQNMRARLKYARDYLRETNDLFSKT